MSESPIALSNQPSSPSDTVSTESTDRSSVNDRIRALEKQLEQKNNALLKTRRQFSRLQKQVLNGDTNSFKRTTGMGRMTLKKMSSIDGEAMSRFGALINHVKTAGWEKNKILPGNWFKWSTDKKSVCSHYMSKVNLGNDEYGLILWESQIVIALNTVLKNKRSNVTRALRSVHRGTSCVILVLLLLLS